MNKTLRELIATSAEGLFQNMPIAISFADEDLNVSFQNTVAYKWIPELTRKKALFIDKMTDYGRVLEYNPEIEHEKIIKHVFERGIDYEFSCEFAHQHRTFQFKFTLSPIRSSDGSTVSGLIEKVENLSEQNELAQALVQSKRFENVGRLASGIAHDFNNILQVIIGHCEIMQAHVKNNEKLKRSLDIILTSGTKASSLTRQLLIFSRKQESEYKVFDPKNTISNLHKILSRMVGEDICIKIEESRNKWHLVADESQIEQIFLNLTVNARDAMPLGGELKISLSDCVLSEMDCSKLNLTKPGKYVLMRFTDSGTGIDSDKLEFIFDPFFTTKASGKGTGLGLATVYSIVRQHQGIITVHSELNVGTVFEIYLPAADGTSQNAKTEVSTLDSETSYTDSILVVEDDPMVSDLASQVLSMHGYVVETAKDIREAIEKTDKASYDLYLIDIVLPDGSGVDLLEYIKEKHHAARFLLSSGYTEDKPQIKRALEEGYDFLHKPYTISTLLGTCREILDKTEK